MGIKNVIRQQLIMSYKIGYMGYMRDNDYGVLPAYMRDIADALQKLGVHVEDIELDVAKELTRGY